MSGQDRSMGGLARTDRVMSRCIMSGKVRSGQGIQVISCQVNQYKDIVKSCQVSSG